MVFKTIFSKKSNNKPKAGKELAVNVKSKSQNFLNFLNQKIQQVKDEITIIRVKCKNLLDTNYKLGMKHLEKGNINEAIFRFRFINKFWPEHLESYYQLAYCFILKERFKEAKVLLEKLVNKNPTYEKDARELLNIISASQAIQTSDEEESKTNIES